MNADRYAYCYLLLLATTYYYYLLLTNCYYYKVMNSDRFDL